MALSVAFLMFPAVAPVASASFTDKCGGEISHGNWKYTFGLGDGTIGPAIKDVKYEDLYHVKFASTRWINLDSDGTLVAMEWTTAGTCNKTYDAGTGLGTSSIVFSSTASSGNDGYAGVTFTYLFTTYAGGDFELDITTSAGGSDRTVPFYMDLDINPTGSSPDSSDDLMEFGPSFDGNGFHAEQRLESNWVAGTSGANDGATYYIHDNSATLTKWFIHTYSAGATETRHAYALKCTACSDSGSSQYTNGPWDYLNADNTWSADVQVVLLISETSSGGGSWAPHFDFWAD